MLFSQEVPFLNEVSINNASFSSSEQQLWDSIAQESTTSSLKLVEISALPAKLSEDLLSFVIPGEGDTIIARGTYFQKNNDTTYTWWGASADGECTIGIASNAGGKLVYISLNEKNWIYHPLSYRYNAQVEVKQDTTLEAEPEIDMPENITTNPDCNEIDFCKSTATALVLLTPEAENEILKRYQLFSSQQQSLFGLLYLALGEITLNYALINSGVVGKSARFVTEIFNDFEYYPFNDIATDLDALIQNQSAADRFHANHADMMVLLTDSRYGNYYGAASSLAPIAIVTASRLGGPRYTFAHEIGHLLGARHNRESNGGDAPDEPNACNYGYRFIGGGDIVRYTIMAATNSANDVRVLYYSNPNITILGTAIGTGFSNNSSYISETFCEIANKIYADDELEIDIDGPLSVSCDQSVTYTINIDPPGTGIPGNAPYSYFWSMGKPPFINPFSTGAVFLGNSSSITIDADDIDDDKFWIFANVVSSDAVFASDLIEVENIPCFSFSSTSSYENILKQHTGLFIVTPNPVDDRLTIKYIQPEMSNNDVTYSIINSLDQVLFVGSLAFKKDESSSEININLEPGFYTLQLRKGYFVESHKIIIQH